MKQMNAKQITLAALAMALVCVSTMMIQIPIPLGYMHLGNCCILLFGVFFSKTIGTLAGGVGSCMADLLSGYPQWILPTLIIKGIMGYAIAAISKDKDGQVKMASWRTLAASAAGIGGTYGQHPHPHCPAPALHRSGVSATRRAFCLGQRHQKPDLLR